MTLSSLLLLFLSRLVVVVYPLACEVTFEDTKVPVENVIGEVGGGFKVMYSRIGAAARAIRGFSLTAFALHCSEALSREGMKKVLSPTD